jgi:hypothetical protein
MAQSDGMHGARSTPDAEVGRALPKFLVINTVTNVVWQKVLDFEGSSQP